jgi:hypothetical protein
MAERAAMLERAGLVVTRQEDHSHAHRAMALDELLAAHRL